MPLISNTRALRDLLDAANNLPDAGDYDVVSINNGDGTQTLEIAKAGEFGPSGTVEITEDGTYDVSEFAEAHVDATSAGRAQIAEAITAKGVDTLPDSTFDTLATNIGLIEGDGSTGVRKIQFEVELDAESDYLPLSRLTEIPDILIVSSYDATLREATSGYGVISSENPSFDHVVSLVANMLPMPYITNNSGTKIIMYGPSAYVYGNSPYYVGKSIPSYDRYQGGDAGWTNPVNFTLAQYQKAFRSAVASNRYALDADGKLVISNNPTGNQFIKKFAANVKYIVTALYDVLDENTIGIIHGLDRSVNSTNVTNTV